MSVIKVRDLKVSYKVDGAEFQALKGVTFAIDRAEILGVVGESGSGKSTIGKALTGMLPSSASLSGDLDFLGEGFKPLANYNFTDLRGCKIGFVFQNALTCLNPALTIRDQMVEGYQTHFGLSARQSLEESIALLASCGLPDAAQKIHLYPSQFSGGMRQRVVIAMALLGKPQLIIADEPTTALDVSIQSEILDLLVSQCKERGVACLFVTHDMGVMAQIADRVMVMHQGEMVECQTAKDLFESPCHPYTASLLAAVPRLHGSEPWLHSATGDNTPAPTEGHIVPAHADKSSNGFSVHVKNARLTFAPQRRIFKVNRRQATTCLDGVTLDLKHGETFGLVGESGSGKSSLAKVITGTYRLDSGLVSFFDSGQPISLDECVGSRKIQMVFQSPHASLNPRMNVFDSIAEPVRYHKLTRNPEETRQLVESFLRKVELDPALATRYPSELSGGQLQRVAIARALICRPRLLICDEPTSALDVSVQARTLGLIKRLQAELGLTILFISHDLAVIKLMCERVGVMKGGALVEVGSAQEVFAYPKHAYTRKLLNLLSPIAKGLAPGR